MTLKKKSLNNNSNLFRKKRGIELQVNFIVLLIIAIVVCTKNCKKNISGLDIEDRVTQEIDTLSVLFVGSSYFSYNSLLTLFDNLALQSGKQHIIGDQVNKDILLIMPVAVQQKTRFMKEIGIILH